MTARKVNGNTVLVFNTSSQISDFVKKELLRCTVNNEALPAELADLFSLTVLVGFNDDGSNRGIVDWS
jgi:hypothetical protein